MKEDFAKLYRLDDVGQVLVMLDESDTDNGAEVRVIFRPSGFGLCTERFGFPDTSEGHALARETFDAMDEGKVLAIVAVVLKSILDLGGELAG